MSSLNSRELHNPNIPFELSPESLRNIIIREFRKLIATPEMRERIREKIMAISDQIQKMRMLQFLDRITGIENTIEFVKEKTRQRLEDLLKIIRPPSHRVHQE